VISYYSQHGEDFILDQMFAGQVRGVFVEVGCIDGKRFSNTLVFEERGWKGLCVEAHTGYIELLKRNRPQSIVCHCAVGEMDKEDIVFYANSRGSLSTVDKSQEKHWKDEYAEFFTGFEEQHIPQKTLTTIFKENDISHVDILSLDIEGYELQALKGLDFSVVKPRALVIEADTIEHEQEFASMLIPNGYLQSVRVAGNIFFVLDPAMHERVKNKVFTDVQITHTRHPLDAGGDLTQKVIIDTRTETQTRPTWKNSLLKLIPDSLSEWFSCIKKKADAEMGVDSTSRLTFMSVGFHGDKYLLDFVDVLTKEVDIFIETGANVGSTLVYFAHKYPHIPCLSCEPDIEAFHHAQRNLANASNATLYNQTSQEFLITLEKQYPDVFRKPTLFWLDAHGYGFKWPLKEELAFITAKFSHAWILIDDFKVPGLDGLGYDVYEEQVCAFDYIKDALNPAQSYSLYYPNYTEHTSQHHPLRGWGAMVFNRSSAFQIPASLSSKIRLA